MALLRNFRRIKNQIFASIICRHIFLKSSMINLNHNFNLIGIWSFMDIVTIGGLVIGCTTGWFSPALLIFTSDDTPLTVDGPMSSFDVGWITAYYEIGALCGVFLFCLIANCIGHKRTLIFCIIPIIVSIAAS